MTEKKRRNQKRRINNFLILIILILIPLTAAAFLWNLHQIENVKKGEGETLVDEEPEAAVNEYRNDQYVIGNNSTAVNKEYFKELNSALEAQDPSATAQAVVKCFITEYYTWTNKDGNYDIGGMQYIFAPKKADFETYTLWNFYEDMALYITKYGRNKLIEVSGVQADTPVSCEFTVEDEEGTQTYPAYEVHAAWTYDSSTLMDTQNVQKEAVFTVAANQGRWEIAAITDAPASEGEEHD